MSYDKMAADCERLSNISSGNYFKEELYGWFSYKQSALLEHLGKNTSTKWEREDGASVYCTETNSDANYKPNWSDTVFIGKLVRLCDESVAKSCRAHLSLLMPHS